MRIRNSLFVMAGLVPAIHVFLARLRIGEKTWMPGTRPGMTSEMLQRLVIVAVAILLRRRDVAVLVVVVFDRRFLRLLRLFVVLFRRLALPASSAHLIPFRRLNRRLLCVPIRGNRMI